MQQKVTNGGMPLRDKRAVGWGALTCRVCGFLCKYPDDDRF